MTDCICRFQGRSLDGSRMDASSDGSVPPGRGLVRIAATEAVKAELQRALKQQKTAGFNSGYGGAFKDRTSASFSGDAVPPR